ncbi:MAG: DNA cytosine methyltransferase [Opitutales bacterium]|nr:DNA cytosine methyltransferase [Opitutales bacterium]
MQTIFRLGELFCGPGGLACGAKSACVKTSEEKYLIRHAWATDYDQSTCETYVKNICNGNAETVVCADIRELNLSVLKKISEIDALAFGFPCNDFSMVGEQKGIKGTFGPLYQYGINALEIFRPKWFLAENVGGLQSANEGKAFSKILRAMFDAGYSVYPHYYSFDKYGVPQARQRIIIVGIRNDLNVRFKVPSPKLYENADVSCRNAIENPPIPENAPNNETTKQSKNVVERLKYIKPGENAFSANLPESLRLNVRGAKISQIYKRLDPAKPAYTVTGSGGGGTHMYHWEEPRALTNRERARLQTFPDDYVFCGSKEAVRKQIGMAVPCRGAQIIFEAILKCFAGVEYESIKAKFPPLIHYSSLEEEFLSSYNFEEAEAFYRGSKGIL